MMSGHRRSRNSVKKLVPHFSMNVGKPPPDAVVIKREPFMVDAQQMQHGGVEVVPGDDIFDAAVADLIGGPIGEAGS